MYSTFMQLMITYIIGLFGGWLFLTIHFPIPWIIGPLTALLIYKLLVNNKLIDSPRLKKVSFSIMGIQIGSTFTVTTIELVTPYLLPFTLLTLIIVGISLITAYFISKWIPIDPETSMLGSVPGGLSAMVAISDSFEANTPLVTIFHTIRLMAVLFIIPFSVTHFFIIEQIDETVIHTVSNHGPIWTIIIYIIAFVIAIRLQHRVPAALVIIPMAIVGGFHVFDISTFLLPNYLYIFAQLTLGIYLGNSISIDDLVKAGKYCIYFFGLAIMLIIISFGFGYVFSLLTDLSLATALLSFAPGGLIEMTVTAQSIGGDPSIVSSLQTIRLLTVVIVFPFVLQGLLPKLSK